MAHRLAILSNRLQRDFDLHFPLIQRSYRTLVQESTHCSPAALISERKLRTLVDLMFGPPPEPGLGSEPGLEYFSQLRQWFRETHAFTRRALNNAGVRQEQAHDTSCTEEYFVKGAQVWKYAPGRKNGVSTKLSSRLTGSCIPLL